MAADRRALNKVTSSQFEAKMAKDPAKELLQEIFPIGSQKEFVIEAPSDKRKRQEGKLFIGRFPLGTPTFAEDAEEEWALEKYEGDPEIGEPGGWKLTENPRGKIHKGTPSSTADVQNLVVLRFTDSATLEVQTIAEAFNFRPTIQHTVYPLEEAEMLMSVKRKPRLASSLKAQLDAAAAQKSNEEAEDPGLSANKATTPTRSQSDSESDIDGMKPKKDKKKRKVVADREVRAARALRDVVATDALIAEIKPNNVEDWEYDEGEADDDMSMGSDDDDQEQNKLEAEYRKYHESDSSEDEGSNKLDKRGKELKKLIKKGPAELAAPPSTHEGNNAPPVIDTSKQGGQCSHPSENSQSSSEGMATSRPSPPVVESNKHQFLQPPREAQPHWASPQDLSEAEVLRFLKTMGSVPLKDLIKPFKPFIHGKEEHRQFINIVKRIAIMDGTRSGKTVTLKEEFR